MDSYKGCFRLPGVPAKVSLALVLAWLFVSPAFGLWLPWASEESKVKKTLEDVWQALLRDDRKLLSQYLAGVGVENFIKQERDLIQRMKIKDYVCRTRTITVDQTRQWAFVDLEKAALLPDGTQFVRRDLSVLQKVNGLWRLVTNPLEKKDQPEADSKPRQGLPGDDHGTEGASEGSPLTRQNQPQQQQDVVR